ncbi:histidine kinase, partial [Rhodoplanes sp. SY1]
IVTGTSAMDLGWEARLRDEVSRLNQRVTAEFLAGLPSDDVRTRLSKLGTDAVVFTPGYFQDGAGRQFTPRESIEVMVAASGAPIYGPFDTFLGTGIVGGRMPSYAAAARQAGHVVSALLDGTPPAELRLPDIVPAALNVDWRQVLRWGIDEDAIPSDAIVHFKMPTFLASHRTEATVAAAVFLLQSALIAWLLVEHYRRRRAEQAVQKQRFELAHASRLAVAGELTGSIAHEVNQPLGAILSNADTVDMILASGVDRRDELREIMADIRRDDLRASEVIRRLRDLLAKHEIERIPFDVGKALTEVELILRPEVRRRGGILDLRVPPTVVRVVGD